MTISATGRRYSYTGNGITVDFAFPRPFAANPDLKVYLVVIATGVATLQTYSTHYTVAGAGLDAGGTVTFLVAPTAAQAVVIFADTDATQNLDLDAVTSWPMTSIEYAFDRLTIMVQEIWDRLLRVPYAPREYINTFDYKLPIPTATYQLGVNAAGTGFEYRNPTGTSWIVAAGAPGVGTGVTGDMYLNSTTGDVYGPKTSVWGGIVVNIKGPAGTPGVGDVVGPASSVLNRIAVFADTTGKLLADGGTLISDLLAKAGGTMTGLLVTVASASGNAGLRLTPGVAPSSPTNGDMWSTSTDLFMRLNGATRQNAFLDSPAFTGTPTAPTPTARDNSTKLPTTAYADNGDSNLPQNAQTGTSYQFVATDRGKMVTFGNAGATAVTIASATHAAGDIIYFTQKGAGQVTFAGSGVTVNSRGGALKTNGQYAMGSIWFESATVCYISGDMTT